MKANADYLKTVASANTHRDASSPSSTGLLLRPPVFDPRLFRVVAQFAQCLDEQAFALLPSSVDMLCDDFKLAVLERFMELLLQPLTTPNTVAYPLLTRCLPACTWFFS